MKAARDTYNLALHLIKEKKAKPNLKLKKLVVTARKEDNAEIRKMKEAPADIRALAVKDLIKTYNSAWAGFKARIQRVKTQKSRWKKRKQREQQLGRRRWKKRKPFDVQFKSKRVTQDAFNVEKKSVKIVHKDLYLYSTVKKFGMRDPIRMSQQLNQPLNCDCKIAYSFGRWYLISPYKIAENIENPTTVAEAMSTDSSQSVDEEEQQQPTQRIVALDPGVRVFQTYYTSEGEQGQIGKDMKPVALKISKKIKALRKRIKKLKKLHGTRKKINRLKKAWYRCNARSQNLVDDFHWKTIKFLLDNFDCVVAPKLQVSSLVHGDNGLDKRTKALMLFQRHSKFNQRLVFKAECRQKALRDLEEHGTSMTCSNCGNIKRDLGRSETYKCERCKMKAGRDSNSARNHLIKAAFGKENY
jgi:transposase